MPFDATAAEQRSSIRRCRRIAELCAIEQPEVNVVVLQRTLTPELRDDAERLSRRAGFRMLSVVAPTRSGKQALTARLSENPQLAADVGTWVEVLADLVECSVIGVRLASAESAACPSLHVDHVSLRVVITYRGAATQFVESADVDREAEGLLRPGALVQAADSGDVVLLKGERWPNNQRKGALHRSPPASPDHPRLVLTLDPLWN